MRPAFAPGFRFSTLDGFVLGIGVPTTALLAAFEPWLGFVVAFPLGHFFLFCNVFRLARTLELAWAAVFVTLCTTTMILDAPGWYTTAAISLGVTILVVAVEMWKPSYHGVGWRRINPDLKTWWDSHGVEGSPNERSAEPELKRVDDG
jgi:hypothetical protein